MFCDVDQDLNIDPRQIEDKITNKTKAIIPVHLTGRPACMDMINHIACANDILVIEDSAQAIGAEYKGKKTGSLGFAGSFSLHPLKNLNVFGDGGFVTTNDDDLASRLRRLRNHGLLDRDHCVEWGFNSRLDSLQAAIGSFNLTHLDTWNERYREIARFYTDNLREYVVVPPNDENAKSVFHNYVINSEKRDSLQHHLQSAGIETKIHYPVLLHKQASMSKDIETFNTYPVAESLNKSMLSLPIYPFLQNDEMGHIVDEIKNFYNENCKK